MRRLRLVVVCTHPVQYHAPWFRHIARECPELDLMVLYATVPTAEQQGVGFGRAFAWDVPLLDGYAHRVVRPARDVDDVHSSVFRGLDVPEIGAAVRDAHPDVALVMGWYSVTLVRALLACRRARIPVLWRGDTNLHNAPGGLRRPAWGLKTRALLRLFDGYLSPGRRVRRYLEHFGVPPHRIFAAPHCVDNAYFARAAAPHQTPEGRAAARAAFAVAGEEFAVLFAGKFEGKKRVEDLLAAVARLARPARLVAVGTGPDRHALAAQARALGVPVTWAGFLNQSELGRAYAAADCLALPSDEGETWGLVVNEAMATGLPCVVSDRVGCSPDLVMPGRTGEVAAFGDPVALADALERVASRQAQGHDFGPECRARAAEYSYTHATAGLVAACQAVAHPAPGVARPRVLACVGQMSSVSGLERMTFEVLRMVRRDGASVHAVVNGWAQSNDPGGAHPIAAMAERIGATWSTGRYWHRIERPRGARHGFRLAGDVVRTSAGLVRDAWRFRPTHILAPDYSTVLRNAPALALLRACGVRVVLRVGNAPVPGRRYRLAWRWGVDPFVDVVAPNSEASARGLRGYGMSPGKVRVVYNKLQAGRARPVGAAREPGRVVYVGQLIPEKGVHLLLDAVALLRAGGGDVRLDVVGPLGGWEAPEYAGYHDRLRARSGAPDLAGCVRLLGYREDVPALLAAASIHCLPSVQPEGGPNVVLEAKLAGVPTVAFALGPMAELVTHGVDGWLAAECTAAALATGIRHYLNPAAAEAAGAAARASLARFDGRAFDAAWTELLGGARAAPDPTPAADSAVPDGIVPGAVAGVGRWQP